MTFDTVNDIVTNDVSEISGNYYAIIGLNPSAGAKSPKLWNNILSYLRRNERMVCLDCPMDKFKHLVDVLVGDQRYLRGAITNPYKDQILDYLHKRNALQSSSYRAVNIIKRISKSKFAAFNSDISAMFSCLNEKVKIDENTKILIIGYGGVGVGIHDFIEQNSPKGTYKIFSRLENRNKLSISKNVSKVTHGNITEINLDLPKADIIINATDLGSSMVNKSHLSILDTEQMCLTKSTALIFDCVYDNDETILQQNAKIAHRTYLNGIKMNFEQAIEGFYFCNPDTDISLVKAQMSLG